MSVTSIAKRIVKVIEFVGYGQWSSFEAFSDFLEMSWAAWMGDEDAYMKAIERYKDKPDVLEAFRQAYGLVYCELAFTDGFPDILGDVYMELRISNKTAGQYFTPSSVAYMMAKMVGPTADEGTEPILVCEPCVGSGVLLLASMKTFWEEGPETFWRGQWYGMDLDRKCVLMASLQTSIAEWWHRPYGLELRNQLAEGVVDSSQAMLGCQLIRGIIPQGIPATDEMKEFAIMHLTNVVKVLYL